MRQRVSTILVTAVLCLASTAAFADLTPYMQDFEALDQADPGALAADGWLVFGIDPNGFYGPFPAPNGGPGFCGIDVNQGGLDQGVQQLVVYNDYNNPFHNSGGQVEANVFQEQVIGTIDVGSTWVFEFDFKRGNIDGATTAFAFIKTIDPNAGFSLSNFITADMTAIDELWNRTQLSIFIDSSLDGQILQIGFLSRATNFEGSGIFYDNLRFIDAAGACDPPQCVEICHKPGTPAEKTLCLPDNAVNGHLGHGDHLGACDSNNANRDFGAGGRIIPPIDRGLGEANSDFSEQ